MSKKVPRANWTYRAARRNRAREMRREFRAMTEPSRETVPGLSNTLKGLPKTRAVPRKATRRLTWPECWAHAQKEVAGKMDRKK